MDSVSVCVDKECFHDRVMVLCAEAPMSSANEQRGFGKFMSFPLQAICMCGLFRSLASLAVCVGPTVFDHIQSFLHCNSVVCVSHGLFSFLQSYMCVCHCACARVCTCVCVCVCERERTKLGYQKWVVTYMRLLNSNSIAAFV